MSAFDNPVPVAVHLQAAWTPSWERGLVLIRRPDNNGWAFPAGYVETGLDKSAEAAAAREFHEETGLKVSEGVLFSSAVTPSKRLLLFVRSVNDWQFSRATLDGWQPTAEASALRIAFDPEDLCFPTHTDAMRLWFESGGRW